jgi:hypothetical protein
MNQDRITTIIVSMKILISNNYHLWIKKIQFTAEAFNVWEYVNSDKNIFVSQKELMLTWADYEVSVTSITLEDASLTTVIIRSAASLIELIKRQQKELKANVVMWNRLIKEITEIKTRLRKIEQIIKISSSIYILSNKQSSSAREITRTLAVRYKLSDVKINEQLHEK